MAQRTRIGIRQVEALEPGQTIWDSSVTGFGARRQRSEAVIYFCFYRTAGNRQRWHTIGRHGAPWTPETARKEAQRLLGLVAKGDDPAADKRAKRKAETVADLCDQYLADAEAGRIMTRFRAPKKASTLAIDKGRVARHIKPLIGRFQVAAVTRDDIEDLLHDVTAGKTAATEKTKPRGLARVRGGRGTANRVVRLLGGIFSYAVKKKMRADNPVRGVTQHKDGERERRLNAEEYRALGAALRKAETQNPWPAVIAVIRFLALTGWRSGEALALRWDEIDLSRRTAFLPDTKTGKSARPLSEAACDVLRSLPYQKTGLVFPATRGDGDTTMSGFKRQFRNIIKAGGLSLEITPHILRHSFASTAADLGYSDLTIGALIGHKGRSMTSRYAHGADPVLLAACDGVANHVLKQMGVTATPARKLPRKGERQAA